MIQRALSSQLPRFFYHFNCVDDGIILHRNETQLPGVKCLFRSNNTHIVYHDVRTDASGAIVPWYNDKPSNAYDHNLRLLWDFWHGMRTCGANNPYYLQHDLWKEKEDDPRGLGGDQIDMAIDSWNLLYCYLGDPLGLSN